MLLHRSHWRRFALLCLFCASWNALARESPSLPGHPRYAIQHFGEHFGLGSATILSLAQDGKGFLWIGTETGLFRYDGNGVTRFGRAEGLPGEVVDFVLTAPDGNVWARARKGIARRLRDRFETVDLPAEAGVLRDGYQSFAVDQSGDLFVATQNGLLRLRPNTKGHDLFRIGSSGVPAAIDAVARAAGDTIWFAAGNSIGRIRPGRSVPEGFVAIGPANQQREERVIALLPAPDGRLWIRTTSRMGVMRVDAAIPAVSWLPDNLPGANTEGGPNLDRHGNLLLPTPQGLYWYSGDGTAEKDNPWRLIDHRSGLISSAIASALEDREGGIWIGTTGTGLDYWPGSKQWSAWTDTEGLPDALILGVVRDHRGRLWVATNTTVCYWDARTARWHTVTQGGVRTGARQITVTPDGVVWTIVEGKGIYRFDANLEQPSEQAVPLLEGWKPHRISAAPDSSVWADGKDELHVIRYQRGRFSVTEVPAPAANAGTTRRVSVSPGGVVWSAGPNGVSRYDRGQWQHFGKQDGLLADNAIEVQAILDDEVWLRYDDESQISLVRPRSGGLNVTHIDKGMCGLGIDVHRNVWAALDAGVEMISPDGKAHVFTEEDGVIWNDLNCGALWQEKDGSILLGTSKGLARYDPSQEEPESRRPSIVLTSATFGKEDHLEDSAPQIKYQDATLLARFASPVFHHGCAVDCRYRLKGLESEFTETDLREARYTSLPAGDYTFEVSCGSSQLGQSPLAAYSFTVLAPWWQTWWARGSAIFGFALLLSGTLFARQRRDRREKARLERAVTERSAELARANQELQEASLSDPLTGIRNRRFFHSTIAADASQAVRAYRGLANYSLDHRDLIFFFVDIDHFKFVNDEYGHDAGDRVLVQIAQRLNTVVRESDFLIRWGGEEFLVVFRSAQRIDGVLLALRILNAINGAEFDLGNGRRLKRSCSVGWAAFPWLPPSCSELSVDEVLRLADRGLYLAKQQGRNRAVGLVPNTYPSAISANPGSDKLCRLEQLLANDLIHEVRTPGEAAAAASGSK